MPSINLQRMNMLEINLIYLEICGFGYLKPTVLVVLKLFNQLRKPCNAIVVVDNAIIASKILV